MLDPMTVVLASIASTLFMAGIIWFVQLVHYPLFASVGPSQFPHYETEHAGRTMWIVAPAMLIEAATSVLLLWVRPEAIAIEIAAAGFLLTGLIWGSTFAMQVPLHAQLSSGFHPALHKSLVATNWIRTSAWTGRAWLALLMIVKLGADA
jgi:hypothetical protein